MTDDKKLPRVVSVTAAASRGISSLVRSAEQGEDLIVERHGKAVAAIISTAHLEELERLQQDLRDSVLLLSRLATDSGERTDLDEAISSLGFDRDELEEELKADLAAGRE